jgi:hypothetical protein
MPAGKNVSDWHKQQHKKQLQKNKTTRIAARDAKVKESKNVEEVKTEIDDLEKRYTTPEMITHAVKSKLDRLKKELKLVEEQAEKEALKASQNAPTSHYQASNNTPQQAPLQFPAVSIYYDAVMNPYGAPPPGQPRLFHSRGGGKTMRLQEAMVPGQPEIILDDRGNEVVLAPPPPPPPPRREQHQQQHRSHESQHRHAPPPPPPPRSQGAPPPPPPINPPLPKQSRKDTVKKQAMIDPKAQPNLPPPSAAVQRMKKNTLAADIWASTEEMEYEQVAGMGSLEGAASVEKQWWYRDTASGATQGPFAASQMLEWVKGGFFPPPTPVRSSLEEPWKTMQQTAPFQSAFRAAAAAADKKARESQAVVSGSNVNQQAAAPVNRGISVQDRIALLKRDRLQEAPAAEEEPEPAMETSVQDRIEALRQEKMREQQEVDKPDESVLDRITALKNERLQQPQGEVVVEAELAKESDGAVSIENGTTESQLPAPPPPPLPPPPPPPPSAFPEQEHDVPSYPIEDTGSIAPYPSAAEDMDYPSYADGDVEYPVDDAYPVAGAYPVSDDYPATDEYPVDDHYPATDEYPADDHYPATDEYPVTDAYSTDPASGETKEEESQPPKKKVKVDQELVAFLPSHLRKRRPPKPAPASSAPSQQEADSKPLSSKSEKDDYERLMNEVEGL